jgi:hypothetical protein
MRRSLYLHYDKKLERLREYKKRSGGFSLTDRFREPPPGAMTEVRNFIAALARAGKGCKEIKSLVDAAYGDTGHVKKPNKPYH